MTADEIHEHKYWTDGRYIYVRESYYTQPSATLRRIDTDKVVRGDIYSTNFNNFKPIDLSYIDNDTTKVQANINR